MKNSQSITPEKLKTLARLLGDGWRYNEIMTSKPDNRGHYLSNGSGLIINVCHSYGENLPQWSLKYPHPAHKNLQRFCVIGCSLDKSQSAIVADLKTRLLSQTGAAYLAWQALIEKEGQKQREKELNTFVVESLKKVLRLNPYHDHRYCEAYRIENDKGGRIAELKKWSSKGDCFRLSIDELTAEQVIKIMQVVKSS
ncbi:hypothetical protein VIOR103205_09050 [Vibrio ordalii]|uniref:hypothetical protein n=1 Tax=Vibrio ordalii TaxID=28174 RepID=UPI00024835BB|nr:hypothetical protein [Vibrio ordalii]